MNKKCESLLKQGNEYLDNNELNLALQCFDKVAKWHPKCEVINQVNKIRMFILERTNQLERAYALCNKYKNVNDIGLQRVRALIFERLGKNDQSLNLSLRLINKKNIDNKSNIELHFLIARIYDKKYKEDKALEYFNEANHIVKISSENIIFNKYVPQKFIDLMKSNYKVINEGVSNNNDSPIFLVGFPRSGTTLLRTILDSHESVSCIEEKPTFPINHELIINDSINAIQFFKNLNKEQINNIKNDYYSKLYEYGNKDNLNIDKFPLRFLDTGIINKIFPNAKYIFVVRHPLDCILSCFMQNFEINHSMANFFTIDESKKFYDKCLSLFKKYTENLNLNVYYIYYENLVNNFEEELKNLMDFIGISIDDKMFEYYNNPVNIFTPSYKQVIKKPYKDSINRYKRYNLEGLDKWIDWFDYMDN